jgi:hypothetical protein
VLSALSAGPVGWPDSARSGSGSVSVDASSVSASSGADAGAAIDVLRRHGLEYAGLAMQKNAS